MISKRLHRRFSTTNPAVGSGRSTRPAEPRTGTAIATVHRPDEALPAGRDRAANAVAQQVPAAFVHLGEYVVRDRFAHHLPAGLDPAAAAPLMCAGITVWEPLGVGPGTRVVAARDRFDVLIDTIPIPHDLRPIPQPGGRGRSGGLPATAAMLEFCAAHGITADVEILASQRRSTGLREAMRTNWSGTSTTSFVRANGFDAAQWREYREARRPRGGAQAGVLEPGTLIIASATT